MEAQLLCRSVIFSTTVWVCHILNYCVGLPCSQHSPTVTMFCVCRLVDKRLLHLQQQCPEAQLLYAFAIFTALTDSIKNLVLCLQACGWETASSTTTVPGGSTTVWVCHIHTTHRHFIYNNSAWRLNYCVCVCRLVGGRLLHLQQQCMEAQLLCGSAMVTALTDSSHNHVLCPAGLWVGDCCIYNNSAWRLNYCFLCLQACGWETALSTTTVPGGSTTVWEGR